MEPAYSGITEERIWFMSAAVNRAVLFCSQSLWERKAGFVIKKYTVCSHGVLLQDWHTFEVISGSYYQTVQVVSCKPESLSMELQFGHGKEVTMKAIKSSMIDNSILSHTWLVECVTSLLCTVRMEVGVEICKAGGLT